MRRGTTFRCGRMQRLRAPYSAELIARINSVWHTFELRGFDLQRDLYRVLWGPFYSRSLRPYLQLGEGVRFHKPRKVHGDDLCRERLRAVGVPV